MLGKQRPGMKLSDFDYHLPPELIAQEPLEDRSASRMLVVDRRTGRWEDRRFQDLPAFLGPGDCLVLNNTRVFPSRLLGQLATTGRAAEVFLLRPLDQHKLQWNALVRPARRLHPGARIRISEALEVEILAQGERGERVVALRADGDLDLVLDQAGHVPLPPYIRRPDRFEDRARYQTVFAERTGSVAAPTAGLHFTPEVLAACRAAGAATAPVTLHVGLGTFQPLASEDVTRNHLHAEWYEIGGEAAATLREAGRIVAVGTTSVRTLETAVRRGGWQPQAGETELFIYPGFHFQATGAMLTNFHLPKSSLLLLVSAFAGRELILDTYRHAVRQRYRFFSYGDCMLIL